MTILQHDIQSKERERQSIQRDIDAFLDKGKMIQILSSTDPSRVMVNFNNSQFKEQARGR